MSETPSRPASDAIEATLARAADALSRGEHGAALQELDAARTDAAGDANSLAKIADLAGKLATVSSGFVRAGAEELAKAARREPPSFATIEPATQEPVAPAHDFSQAEVPPEKFWNRNMSGAAALVVALGAAAIIGLVVWSSNKSHTQASSSGSADHSVAIATTIGASSCSDSGYYVQSKLDGSKQTIYNCDMPSGNTKCVTEDGGIASDSTEEVRLLFQNTLGATKPGCLE